MSKDKPDMPERAYTDNFPEHFNDTGWLALYKNKGINNNEVEWLRADTCIPKTIPDMLKGWVHCIKKSNKGHRRKNRLIKRLRANCIAKNEHEAEKLALLDEVERDITPFISSRMMGFISEVFRRHQERLKSEIGGDDGIQNND